jgi:hypothetical protein
VIGQPDSCAAPPIATWLGCRNAAPAGPQAKARTVAPMVSRLHSADPARCHRLGADRRPGRGEGHPAGEGLAGRSHRHGAGHGEGGASSCCANWAQGAQAGRGGGLLIAAARGRHRQNRLIARSFSDRCPSRRTITRSPLRHDSVESAALFNPLPPRHVMARASASCTGHSIWSPMFIGTGSSMIGSGSVMDFCARSKASHRGFLADKPRCVVGQWRRTGLAAQRSGRALRRGAFLALPH